MKKSNLERKEMKKKIISAMLTLIMVGMLSMACITIPNVVASDVHDIAVISVEPNVTHQYPGRVVNIKVMVINYGNVSETNFNVTAYNGTALIDKIPIPSLGPSENTTVVFHWSTAGLPPCHNYTISANATIVSGDINATNNKLTDGIVKIVTLGNINGDGIIDLLDLVKAADALGTVPSSPGWNPLADIWPDGYVDIFDLVMIAIRFGQHC